MSKRRHSQPTGLRDRARRMASKLRDNYQLGKEANRESKKNGVSTQQFAEDRGLSEHTVRKLRAFARAYNARELSELCALRRPNGLPLHWGYVIYLLAAAAAAEAQGKNGKEVRSHFAREVESHGWTAPQLYAAIRKKLGLRPGHGRKMSLPLAVMDAARQVENEGKTWSKRLKLFISARLKKKQLSQKTKSTMRSEFEKVFASLVQMKRALNKLLHS